MEKEVEEIIKWLLDPFKKNLKWKGLIKRWFYFFIVGIIAMSTIQYFAKYDFSEADTLTSETGKGCDKLAMALLVILPPIEELLFRILPHRYFGNRAAFIGSIIWAGLHLLGRNLAIVGFQIVMGIFYYKLVSSKRYKEAIIFHEVFNFIPLSSCFFY